MQGLCIAILTPSQIDMRKPTKAVFGFIVGVIFVTSVYVGWTLIFAGNDDIQLIQSDKPYTSVVQILQDKRFKNKVVYGDIWGTSCLPCLEEFKHHTQPLKQHYKGREDIAFLYLCIDNHPGAEYRWKKRIKEYNIQGHHVLLTEEQFNTFYDQVVGRADPVKYIPRYFIADRGGQVIVHQARRPSENKALYSQIDSTLNL
ncbi:hypothetical protein GCM10028816_39830 [Spirosoma lituiforme]